MAAAIRGCDGSAGQKLFGQSQCAVHDGQGLTAMEEGNRIWKANAALHQLALSAPEVVVFSPGRTSTTNEV